MERARVRTSWFWFWMCSDLPVTLGSPSSPRGSDQCSLRTPSSSSDAGVNFDLTLVLCFVFPLSVPNQFQFEAKEIPRLLLESCGGSLPMANFSSSVSFLQKLAASTFQLIAYWHTPDSKYLCSSQESLIQLSTWSRQPALWFQHLRISKRGNMQMPKSPRENSSGEAVIGGRERGSDERYYRSLETGKSGWGKGRGGESEDWKSSHLIAHAAVFFKEGLSRSAELQISCGGTCREPGLVLAAGRKCSITTETTASLYANKSPSPTCWQTPTTRIMLQCVW